MRSKRSHRKGSPDQTQTASSPPPQQPSFSARSIVSPPQTTPDQSRGIYSTVMNGTTPMNSSAAAPPPNVTPGQSFSTPIPSNQPISFAPVNQPPPSGEPPSEEGPSEQRENGGMEYSRDQTGGGATGEALGAGPEVTVDANGERRVMPDTEMTEAQPEGQSSSGAGGFTAVNR